MNISDLTKFLDPLKKRIMNIISKGQVESVDDSKGIQRVKAILFADEVHNSLERFQNYGMTSNPPEGSSAIVLFHSGNRDHGIVVSVDNRLFRIKNLKPGEVAFYSDEGDSIIFKRENKLEVTTKELTINAAEKVITNTKTMTIIASEAVNITTQEANITSPIVKINAETSVDITSPVLNVSGLVNCAGIGAGVPAVPGKAKIAGDLEASGSVKDGAGTMAEMRTKYNTHNHPTNTTPNPTM